MNRVTGSATLWFRADGMLETAGVCVWLQQCFVMTNRKTSEVVNSEVIAAHVRHPYAPNFQAFPSVYFLLILLYPSFSNNQSQKLLQPDMCVCEQERYYNLFKQVNIETLHL